MAKIESDNSPDLIKITIYEEHSEYGSVVSESFIDLWNGDTETTYSILKKNLLKLPAGDYSLSIKHYSRLEK